MTETELVELERLEKAATPGPWEHRTQLDDGTPWHDVIYTEPFDWGIVTGEHLKPEDAAVIAAGRNALPKLIKEIRMLRGTISAGLCRPGLGD